VWLTTGPAQKVRASGPGYAKALKTDGIEVVLVPLKGSAANHALLRCGRVDLALCSFPAPTPVDLQNWRRWAACSSELLAVLQRNSTRLTSLNGWRTQRVNRHTGGVPSLNWLFDGNRIDPFQPELSRL
jgi:hypothetical protein